jgi:hypothetical protein
MTNIPIKKCLQNAKKLYKKKSLASFLLYKASIQAIK